MKAAAYYILLSGNQSKLTFWCSVPELRTRNIYSATIRGAFWKEASNAYSLTRRQGLSGWISFAVTVNRYNFCFRSPYMQNPPISLLCKLKKKRYAQNATLKEEKTLWKTDLNSFSNGECSVINANYAEQHSMTELLEKSKTMNTEATQPWHWKC